MSTLIWCIDNRYIVCYTFSHDDMYSVYTYVHIRDGTISMYCAIHERSIYKVQCINTLYVSNILVHIIVCGKSFICLVWPDYIFPF